MAHIGKALPELASQAWQEMPEWGIGLIRERERRKVMDELIQVRVCGIQLEDDDSQWGSYTESKNA